MYAITVAKCRRFTVLSRECVESALEALVADVDGGRERGAA
jgi:hypothetical protein